MHTSKTVCCFLAVAFATGRAACGQTAPLPGLPNAKPVPAMQVIPKPHHRASFMWKGKELTTYHFDASLRRPFLYPIQGPAGHSLTRMGHPHLPSAHRHHNSVWISHHDVAGVDFWSDQGKGRIVHQRTLKYEDGEESSAIVSENHWKTTDGKLLLVERRRTEVQSLGQGQWMLVIDLQFKSPGRQVTLGKTPLGMIGVRMAKTLGVSDGGGTIRNSAGAVNERGVLGKRAKWVDYSGPIAKDTAEGITLMDHPNNPQHPTIFHARDDGWMGASLTHSQAITITPNRPLSLRYALYIHSGVPSRKAIGRRFDAFSRSRGSDLWSDARR